MNQIAKIRTDILTMSSREIAELCEKRHDHVLRDIRNMLEELGITDPSLGASYRDASGRELPCFHLPKDLTITLIAGYNVQVRHRIVVRWQELETQPVSAALPNFANPAEAARAWAEQYELREAANQALAIAAPKAEFVDRYVDGTGLKGFRQVCKLLNANESRFRDFLTDHRIMYRLGGEWVPYQQHIDAGRFSVKTGVSERTGHAFTEAKFTPKGVNWVAGEWAKHQLQEAA